jgi:subtilisin family serine protease
LLGSSRDFREKSLFRVADGFLWSITTDQFTPANVPEVITVTATEIADKKGLQEDARAPYSNYGGCADIYAPGSLITSAWIGGPNEQKTISGTSMASPHVAGAAAIYLSAHPNASPKEVEDFLLQQSTKDAVDTGCAWWEVTCKFWTKNRLLHLSDCRAE